MLAVAPAFELAASLATSGDADDLGIGAHLALVGEDPPLLGADEVPTLVDRRGNFAGSWRVFFPRVSPAGSILPTSAGSSRPSSNASAGVGVPLTHLDTHQHLHLWPLVRDVVVDLAVEHGVPALRVPGSRAAGPVGVVVRRRAAELRGAAAGAGLSTPDRFAGLDEGGRLDDAALCGTVAALGDGLPARGAAELGCHPGQADDPERRRYRWGYPWPEELAALRSRPSGKPWPGPVSASAASPISPPTTDSPTVCRRIDVESTSQSAPERHEGWRSRAAPYRREVGRPRESRSPPSPPRRNPSCPSPPLPRPDEPVGLRAPAPARRTLRRYLGRRALARHPPARRRALAVLPVPHARSARAPRGPGAGDRLRTRPVLPLPRPGIARPGGVRRGHRQRPSSPRPSVPAGRRQRRVRRGRPWTGSPPGEWPTVVIVDVLYLLGADAGRRLLAACAAAIGAGRAAHRQGDRHPAPLEVPPRRGPGAGRHPAGPGHPPAPPSSFLPPDDIVAGMAGAGLGVTRHRIDRWLPPPPPAARRRAAPVPRRRADPGPTSGGRRTGGHARTGAGPRGCRTL